MPTNPLYTEREMPYQLADSGARVMTILDLLFPAATMILLPRFKTKDVVKVIRHEHPTLFPGIPTMYLAVMEEAARHPDDFRSIKYCISGAAPLPARMQADFEAITGGKLVEGYRLSEAGPVTHCNPLLLLTIAVHAGHRL